VAHREASPLVSIIFPAYNEEKRLPPTLERTVTFLQQQPYDAEVVVVENGSTDQTVAVVEQFIRHYATASATNRVTVRLLRSAKGKGAAVKLGMLEAAGEYLVMSDADLSVPIEDLPKFLPPALPAGSFDVAIASREVPGAIRHGEPEYRHLMGRVFNFLVRVIAVPHVQDTQCGFKCFTRRAARFLFPLQQIDGWGFDVEILHIASRHGLKMVEIPVSWYYGQNSRIEPLRDTLNMVNELIKVRLYGWRGCYTAERLP
jgi:dolichyl-phosphate beta-glucosyltransferase